MSGIGALLLGSIKDNAYDVQREIRFKVLLFNNGIRFYHQSTLYCLLNVVGFFKPQVCSLVFEFGL